MGESQPEKKERQNRKVKKRGKSLQSQDVMTIFVFYCHITNYRRLCCLKQHTFIISYFPQVRSPGIILLGSLLQGFSRLQSRSWQKLWSLIIGSTGDGSASRFLRLLTEFISCCCSTEVLFSSCWPGATLSSQRLPTGPCHRTVSMGPLVSLVCASNTVFVNFIYFWLRWFFLHEGFVQLQ